MIQNESENLLESIAVVAMAGRFPGVNNLKQFWQYLCDGQELITLFTDEELRAAGIPEEQLKDANYVKARSILADIDLFDAKFFDVSPREAEIMDPQHRILLECAWEALELAGYTSEKYNGRVGVFTGCGASSYLQNNVLKNPDLTEFVDAYQVQIGNDKDYIPTRISYKLNLTGPSVSINTACSSSLVAVHFACQTLLNYSCDMALAGGVSIEVPQNEGYFYREGGIPSPDGHCRAFDAQAQGTVPGNGAGLVVLKRLEDALNDGDLIYALIKGSAVNNDGSQKVGYTAPSVEGQTEVIVEAQALAGIDPDTVSYVEAHGTGTPLGDPIEIEALTQAFRMQTQLNGFCAIGSVKSNLGHLDSAAGVTGLIKTVLALKEGKIPPSLHFKTPNPKLNIENSPFYVNAQLSEWRTNGFPRRAGVSSFGIGGTNAHAVLEEAPERERSGQGRDHQLVLISAKTEAALKQMTQNLACHLKENSDINLADVAFTLQKGRRDFDYRRMLVCANTAEVVQILDSKSSVRMLSRQQIRRQQPVVFMFPGQGAQYVNMGLDLYRNEPFFREQVDRCAEILKIHLGEDIRSVLFCDATDEAASALRLKQTVITQPALFVVEYALAKLWMSWGIQPQAMIGHSVGEYVAACLAGVFSLEDALRFIAERGRLIQELPGGSMLAVPLSEKRLEKCLSESVSIAAMNGPEMCVISGSSADIKKVEARLASEDIKCVPLHTSHAFHSPMMEPILDSFRENFKTIELNSPQIPIMSTVTGNWIQSVEMTSPDYWCRNIRRAVRFNDAISRLLTDNHPVFLEIGPGRTLTTLAMRHPQKNREQMFIPSLRHPNAQESDSECVMLALGKLWLCGVSIDWDAFYSHEKRYRVPLPTYPFERRRFWSEPQKNIVTKPVGSQAPVKKSDISEWLYIPVWKQSKEILTCPLDTKKHCWLVLRDSSAFASALVNRLKKENQQVIEIMAGNEFTQTGEDMFTVNPHQKSDYERLFSVLNDSERHPEKIVHLWCLKNTTSADFELRSVENSLQQGFYSLLYLAQILGKNGSPGSIELIGLTNNLQSILGTETGNPLDAALTSALKVIPQEYSGLRCRAIDIQIPIPASVDENRIIEQVDQEIRSTSSENNVSYRGLHRWVQTFERLQPVKNSVSETRLKSGGTYLITGGLGGVGLEVAEYLARTVKAKLMLMDFGSFPERSEWDKLIELDSLSVNRQPDNGHSGFKLDDEIEFIVQTEKNIHSEYSIKTTSRYPGLEKMLNQLCLAYIGQYLREQGLNIQKGKKYQIAELDKQLRIIHKFKKFQNLFLNYLFEDGVISSQTEEIKFLKELNEIPDIDSLKSELNIRFPEFSGLFALLDHCARNFTPALRGEIEAISVLYPDGSNAFLQETEKNTIEHTFHRVYLELLKQMILRFIEQNKHRKVRILELGGGGGSVTWMLAPALNNKNVEYCFTDIGRSFILKAEKKALECGFNFMTFSLFDINKDPIQTGLDLYGFDIIIGLDVVHVARDLNFTIENIKKLLAPDGLLCILETVKSTRWVNMIWGLAEGWWHFEDYGTRQITPLMNIKSWDNLLRSLEFQNVKIFPENSSYACETDCALIVAQQIPEIKFEKNPAEYLTHLDKNSPVVAKIKRLKKMEETGSEIMISQADVADEEMMQDAISTALKTFGKIDGIFHTAAIEGGGTIQQNAVEKARKEFRPKLLGALVLEKLAKNIDLDFILHFSSHNSILGGFGQVGYCAANAFLDALANLPAGERRPFIQSVNWDRWQNTGLAVDVEKRHFKLTSEEMEGGMLPSEGIEALDLILKINLPQVVVSARDFNLLLKNTFETEKMSVEIKPENENSLTVHQSPAQNSIKHKLIEFWEKTLGVENINTEDNFFELGGDSLIGLQVMAMINKEFKQKLPAVTIYEAPNIDALTRLLSAESNELPAFEQSEDRGNRRKTRLRR